MRAGSPHSRLCGVTRNPWNPEFGVGGSSGGSGAALACGDDDARRGSRHRRLDPHPRLVQRRRRVQAALRPRAAATAVQPRHLLPLRAAGAHRGRLRAVRERARRAGPDGHRVAAAEARAARRRSRASRACASRSASTSAAGRSTRRSGATRCDAAAALREAGAIVEEVGLDVPASSSMRAAALHYRLGFGGDDRRRGGRAPRPRHRLRRRVRRAR